MSTQVRPWPARADSALAATLALWAGVLASAGLTAAVAFPAMKRLGPTVPGIPEAVPDHWIIAAGSIAQRVFELSGIAQLASAAIALVLAMGRFTRMRRSSPRAGATLLASVIVAAGATAVSTLALTPSMARQWADALQAARAGEVERVASIRRGFESEHRLVSAMMQGTLFFTLAGLGITLWTAPGGGLRHTP